MLSLIFNLLKDAVEYKFLSDKTDDMQDIIARIENAYRTDEPASEKTECLNKDGYCYKTGSVTFIGADYVLIDNYYVCDVVHVKVQNLQIDDMVQFVVSLQSQGDDHKVKKIVSKIETFWDDTSQYQTDVPNVQTLKRSMIGKVIGRKNRKLFIQPNNICINLNTVESDFLPVIGDWVQCESNVEVDENSIDLSGEVLEISRIQPLRSKLDVGVISSYNSDKGFGVIGKNIIFNKGVCDPGYAPRVGDKVISDCIESEQGIYTWRSLTVVPVVQVSGNKFELPSLYTSEIQGKNLDELIKNKFGIIITDNLVVHLNIQEEKNVTVTVQNVGDDIRVLDQACFMSQKTQSQLTLEKPLIKTSLVLNPSDTISYTFKCMAKFVGTSKELFIFKFKGFEIGRVFNITVKSKNTSAEKAQSVNDNKRINKPIRIPNLIAEPDEATYIPGVRPCKPPSFFKVRNATFRVPQHYWNLILELISERKTLNECRQSIEDAIPCLSKVLSFQSYKDRFHALLYLEEIAQTLNMEQYEMDSTIMRHSGEYLAMKVPGLAEKRPSLLIGDRAVVSFKWDCSEGQLKYEGFIHKVANFEIYLKFNQKFHDEYNNQDCRVRFKCSQSAIQRCHNAINMALNNLGLNFLFPKCVIEKEPQLNLKEIEIENQERLFNVESMEEYAKTSPEKNSEEANIYSSVTSPPSPIQCDAKELEPYMMQVKKRKLVWFNKDLNFYQKEAVRNILNGCARPLPYVIFGPPGTGKTVTLCETILQILTVIPESRLLVATPSNSSANLIAERLLDSSILKPGDMVRLIAHHCLTGDSIPDNLLPYCATGDLSQEGTSETIKYNGIGPRVNCTMSVLGRHRITIGTCIALGILHNMGFPHGHFSHVLVDEAGQATEPEIIIPLNFIQSDKGQVILVGDPLQLGPVVQSNLAKDFGLDESFLSRLLQTFPYQRDPHGFERQYDPRLVTKLIMNYRSLPEILQLSNSLFYDSELQPQVSPDKSDEAKLLRLLASELPEREGQPPAIIFHGVNGENCKDPESPSWYNPEEATQVYLYLLKLYKRGLSADDIGIITPYQKQVLQIRDLLLELDIPLPKISSVEGFQGQERKVIIISAVRSSNNCLGEDIKHSLGFVACPRRLNVAITRARALLIILGNPKLLAQDTYWRNVLIYCTDVGAYTGCNFLPSSMEQDL